MTQNPQSGGKLLHSTAGHGDPRLPLPCRTSRVPGPDLRMLATNITQTTMGWRQKSLPEVKPEDSPVRGDGTAALFNLWTQGHSTMGDQGNQPTGHRMAAERNVGEPTNFTTDAAERRPRQSHSSRENRQAESRTTREKTRPQVGSWKGPTKQPRLHPHGTGDSSHHGRKGKWRHQQRPYRSGKDDRREPRVLTRVATSQTRS